MKYIFKKLAGKFDSFILISLLTVDLCYLVGSIYGKDPLLSLEYDQGFPEFFQYQKFIWISISLLACWAKTNKAFFPILSTIPIYLLFDDHEGFHEEYGRAIAMHLTEMRETSIIIINSTNFRSQDLGEAIFMFLIATIIFCFACISYKQAKEKIDKKYILETSILILFFGFFAVFIDALHQLVNHAGLYQFIGFLEDFGEMVAVTLWCALSYRYTKNTFSRVNN